MRLATPLNRNACFWGGSENRGPPIPRSQILFIKNKEGGVACPHVQKHKGKLTGQGGQGARNTEYVAKTKSHADTCMRKPGGQGGQGARITGVSCKSRTLCSKTHNEIDRPGRPGHQNHRSVMQKQNAIFKNTQRN